MQAPATFPDEPEPAPEPRLIRWLRWWDPACQEFRMTPWPHGSTITITTSNLYASSVVCEFER